MNTTTHDILRPDQQDRLQSKPLRVLMVSDYPCDNVVVGGVQSAVQILAEALSEQPAIEHLLVVRFDMQVSKSRIIRVNDKLTIHEMAGQRRLGMPTMSIFDYLNTRKVAGAFKPHIVHGQGIGSQGDIAVRLGYPSVVTIHGAGTFEVELREKDHKIIGPVRVWLAKKMTERVVRNADVIISISEFDKTYSYQHRSGNIIGIPNAVRKGFFAEPPVFPDEPRIIFNGLITERKNIIGLVRSFAKVKERVPDAILDIAGPIVERSHYEQAIAHIPASIKDSIIFHGNLTGEKLVPLMRRSAVAVLFSIYENLPVAIAEALALGKPVVATRVGGIPEMIQDGKTGFLVDSNDEDAFSERIVRLLRDPAMRKTMGTQGNEVAVSKWLPASVAAETLHTYRLAIETFHKKKAMV